MSRLRGFRTILLNTAIFVTMLGAALSGQITDAGTLQAIILVTTVANVIIRFFTDTAVGKAE